MQFEMIFYSQTPINTVRLWIDQNGDGILSGHEEIKMFPTSATWRGEARKEHSGRIFVCRLICLQNTEWQFRISDNAGTILHDTGRCTMTASKEQLVGKLP